MDKKKRLLCIASMASVIVSLTTCQQNNIKNNDPEVSQFYEDTTERMFEVGEHFITRVYPGNILGNGHTFNQTIDIINNLYIPEGYSIVDFEIITQKGDASGVAVVFANNKPVNAVGVKHEDGNYHFNEFGEIVKGKALVKDK